MAIQVRSNGRVGMEIRGIDLGGELSRDEFDLIRTVLADHGVVFFRDQSLDEEQHIAFARRFGRININRFFAAHPRHPEIALVVKEADERDIVGSGWHTDDSYDAAPTLGSVLVARELPPEGGATTFASMYTAYDSLPGYLRNRIDNAWAVHSARHVFGTHAGPGSGACDIRGGATGDALGADAPDDVAHPMVITHPLSGKRAIYVNPVFTTAIVGLSGDESRALLGQIYDHCQNPAFQEVFHWRPGSVALWDNRATWHLAHNDYHGHRREMHRITIEGEPLN